VSGDPLGLLAVERERLAVLRSPQHDGSPQTATTANVDITPLSPHPSDPAIIHPPATAPAGTP
jgi:hypothetical protein